MTGKEYDHHVHGSGSSCREEAGGEACIVDSRSWRAGAWRELRHQMAHPNSRSQLQVTQAMVPENAELRLRRREYTKMSASDGWRIHMDVARCGGGKERGWTTKDRRRPWRLRGCWGGEDGGRQNRAAPSGRRRCVLGQRACPPEAVEAAGAEGGWRKTRSTKRNRRSDSRRLAENVREMSSRDAKDAVGQEDR